MAQARERKYDRNAVCADIFLRMRNGEWLKAILRTEGMPNVSTFFQWLEEDKDLANQYTHARTVLLDVTAEETIQIADTPQVGQKTVSKATGMEITEGDMVEHRRLQIETRKWLLSKLAPKKYGDKQQIEHSGTVSIADALREARAKRGGG